MLRFRCLGIMVLSVGAVLSPVGSEPVAVGIVAWGREGAVGRVVSWVAVGVGIVLLNVYFGKVL